MSVCTPAQSHAPIVIQAAQSGKVKAIYCEKALGVTLEEAEMAVDACKKSGVVLVVNYLRRWSGDYIMAKKIIKEGWIGKIQTVYGIFSGNIMHTGTHMFDLLLYFFGEPLWVKSKLQDFKAQRKGSSGYMFEMSRHFNDPDATALIRFQNDIDVFVSGLSKDYFIFEMDIIGEKGRIRIGNFLKELWISKPSIHYKGFRELCRVPYPEFKNARNGD